LRSGLHRRFLGLLDARLHFGNCAQHFAHHARHHADVHHHHGSRIRSGRGVFFGLPEAHDDLAHKFGYLTGVARPGLAISTRRRRFGRGGKAVRFAAGLLTNAASTRSGWLGDRPHSKTVSVAFPSKVKLAASRCLEGGEQTGPRESGEAL